MIRKMSWRFEAVARSEASSRQNRLERKTELWKGKEGRSAGPLPSTQMPVFSLLDEDHRLALTEVAVLKGVDIRTGGGRDTRIAPPVPRDLVATGCKGLITDERSHQTSGHVVDVEPDVLVNR